MGCTKSKELSVQGKTDANGQPIKVNVGALGTRVEEIFKGAEDKHPIQLLLRIHCSDRDVKKMLQTCYIQWEQDQQELLAPMPEIEKRIVVRKSKQQLKEMDARIREQSEVFNIECCKRFHSFLKYLFKLNSNDAIQVLYKACLQICSNNTLTAVNYFCTRVCHIMTGIKQREAKFPESSESVTFDAFANSYSAWLKGSEDSLVYFAEYFLKMEPKFAKSPPFGKLLEDLVKCEQVPKPITEKKLSSLLTDAMFFLIENVVQLPAINGLGGVLLFSNEMSNKSSYLHFVDAIDHYDNAPLILIWNSTFVAFFYKGFKTTGSNISAKANLFDFNNKFDWIEESQYCLTSSSLEIGENFVFNGNTLKAWDNKTYSISKYEAWGLGTGSTLATQQRFRLAEEKAGRRNAALGKASDAKVLVYAKGKEVKTKNENELLNTRPADPISRTTPKAAPPDSLPAA